MARRNAQTLKGRIAGATGSYLGNSGRHQLVAGNNWAVIRLYIGSSVRALE